MKTISCTGLQRLFLLCLLSLPVSLMAGRGQASVLILYSGAQKDEYLAEMLTAEGFHSVAFLNTNSKRFTPADLLLSDLLIVPAMNLSAVVRSTVLGYAEKGGNLIVLRPQAALAGALGFTRQGAMLTDGYLQIDDNPVTGHGLLPQRLQWHGNADLFRAAGKKQKQIAAIARLSVHSGKTLHCPAVAFTRYGRGQVILFFYDLSLSVLLSRQGNSRLAAMETDSINGIRAMDMFTGGWVDTANNTLNQTDEQMRLLSRCIETLTANRKPQPRCWYFPDTLKSLITLTNDGEYRSAADFAAQFSDVAAHHARMTLYVLSPEKIDSAFVDSSLRNGFEIAAHPDATAQAKAPTWAGVDSAIKRKSTIMSHFPGVAPVRTNTNHWFVWCGSDRAGRQNFSAGAEIEALNGIRMDVNYAHYDNKAAAVRFLGPTGYRQGNFTGSGLPMKFGSADKKIIDVYQLFNNVYDQEYMENQDPDGYDSCFRGLLDRSLNKEIFSVICIRSHNDEYFFSRTPLLRMLDDADEKKIPVWSVNRLLDFLTARDSVSFEDITWSHHRLSFRANGKTIARDRPTLMLPAEFGDLKLAVVRANGKIIPASPHEIKGKKYLWFAAPAGEAVAITAEYR